MKTLKINSGSLFFLGLLLILSLNTEAQDNKLSRQEKKEAKKAQLNENFRVLDSLLTSKRFVLEANFLQNTIGEMVSVSSNLNFVKVDGSYGILQTGSETRMGYNGVGGVTAEGNIGAWKVEKDPKNLTYRLAFTLTTKLGTYDIFLTVNAANDAKATISGSRSGKLTWNGYLASFDNSRIFKGQETF